MKLNHKMFQLLMGVWSMGPDYCISEINLRETEFCVLLKQQLRMKQKMIIFISLGNTIAVPHLQYCAHLKENTELEVMQRRDNGVLHSMEWLSVKRHLRTTFWLQKK